MGSYHLLCVTMETRGTPSEMHVLNLTNIYEVYISHNCQTVTMNRRKCNTTISLPISVKHIIRGPYGGLSLVILRAHFVMTYLRHIIRRDVIMFSVSGSMLEIYFT